MLLKCIISYLIIYLFVILNLAETARICNTTTGRIYVSKLNEDGDLKTTKTKKCCLGFKKSNGKCVPYCDIFCENGKCIGNNVCECTKGFKILSPSRCIPECSNCENGNCIGPEKCDCYHGYKKSDNGLCVPECDPPCVNAECISQNKCKCNGSFKFINNTHCVSDNFILKRDMCVKACDYGNCDEFNQCICSKGYESHDGSCKIICDKECINGKCLNDQCACDNDFVKFNSTNCVTKEFLIQRDDCEKICSNGICSDSNECFCNDGFKFNALQNKCIPTCSFGDFNECINGICVAPNECKCYAGYKLDTHAEYQCDPVCENCTNGFCIEPGLCECNKGFILETTGCIIEDHFEMDMDYPAILTSETEAENSFQSTTENKESVAIDSRKEINAKYDEIASNTLSSFNPMSTTEFVDVFKTDESYQNLRSTSDVSENTLDYDNTEEIQTTTSSFDTFDESLATTVGTFKYVTDSFETLPSSIITDIEIDEVSTNIVEITTTYNASFEKLTTSTNYDATNNLENDDSSLLIVTESTERIDPITFETDESTVETTSSDLATSTINEIEFKRISDNTILDSPSTMEALITNDTDLSEMTTNDISTTSPTIAYSFYDKMSSTFKDNINKTTAFSLEYSESSIGFDNFETTSDSSFIKAEINSNTQELFSSTDRNNIQENLSTASSILMESTTQTNFIIKSIISSIETTKFNAPTAKDVSKLPLSLCEKPCDNGSCSINGKCPIELNSLKCICKGGLCIENICVCKKGFIASSDNSSVCIKEVQVIFNNNQHAVSKQTASFSLLYWFVLTPLLLAGLFIIIPILYKLRGPGKSYLIESQEMSENCAYYVKAHSVDKY